MIRNWWKCQSLFSVEQTVDITVPGVFLVYAQDKVCDGGGLQSLRPGQGSTALLDAPQEHFQVYFSHFSLAHKKCEGRRALQCGTHHMDPENVEPMAAAVGTLIVEVPQTVHGRWVLQFLDMVVVEAFHQCFIEPCVSGSHLLAFFLCTFPPLAVIIGTLFPRTPIWLVVLFFRNASGGTRILRSTPVLLSRVLLCK